MTGAESPNLNFDPPPVSGGVSLGNVAGVLLALFALDNILLLQFLGLAPVTVALMCLTLCPILMMITRKLCPADIRIPWSAIMIAGAISVTLFALGGQGRFFYANPDWQVRDSILADMARYPWPFAYDVEGRSMLLRAPIGIYLLPSLAGGGWHEIAMLLSNSLRLTLLLVLAWPLFLANRLRVIALVVFLFFSGMDIIGTAFVEQLGVDPSWDHLEHWSAGFQYSAHITQAFWVPQHALAGWACAVFFLLWHRGLFSIGLFAAIIPLVAIWSPLAIMGAIPFALWAGITALKQRSVMRMDIALAASALALAIPALAYLQLDAAKVGGGLRETPLAAYLLVVLLEVLPFALPLLRSKFTPSADKPTLLIVLSCLLLMPFFQIGLGSDFQMRASIMPLALLAMFFAEWLCRAWAAMPNARNAVLGASAVLIIAAMTPIFELKRAMTLGSSPKPLCSLAGVWTNQEGLTVAPYATYFAHSDALPPYVGSMTVLAGKNDPSICWDRPWIVPDGLKTGEPAEGKDTKSDN